MDVSCPLGQIVPHCGRQVHQGTKVARGSLESSCFSMFQFTVMEGPKLNPWKATDEQAYHMSHIVNGGRGLSSKANTGQVNVLSFIRGQATVMDLESRTKPRNSSL